MSSELPSALPVDRSIEWPDRVYDPDRFDEDMIEEDEIVEEQDATEEGDDSYMHHPHHRMGLLRGLDEAEEFIRTGSEDALLEARRLLRRFLD